MATVQAVERKIFRVEGFRVVIRHLDGRNVRGDREHLPAYPFDRAMKNRSNVKDWKRVRFQPRYPGFEVDVIAEHGGRVHGGTLLGTVRDEYLEG
ncbi:MAG TPA: hypothetical protein VF094_09495 [Gaiellaceae bacterium]